jgi:hypothetical protein
VLAGNLAREYLQARTLLALQQAGAMIPMAFQGGTALRFLFGLPRFSEDLDFALERPERGSLLTHRIDWVSASKWTPVLRKALVSPQPSCGGMPC